MTGPKFRLDRRLVDLGLVESRAKAQGLLLAGKIQVNGRVQTKAGLLVSDTDQLTVVGPRLPFVSRGGLKLQAALTRFGIRPKGWNVVDVGASTGGFTDCWLQSGASKVYAVDVGYGQLAWKLRNDPRVIVRERLNARWLTLEQLDRSDALDGASIDASFIGATLLLGPLTSMISGAGAVIVLVKPQFEAGPEHLSKHGVVRDPEVHRQVLERFLQSAQNLGYAVLGLMPSPIRGPEGNIEFLAYLSLKGTSQDIMIDAVVKEAWQEEWE
ncbi:MAG: TlyA family rRNA (cytidine-2'-O)-methyltransferase [Sulfobacillus benefaciens]|uniref:TlyA family rRNA (Cytidine-2'-O)-methyltransferase n=1 Tax=Sulfobacillus benefaciens TaxID=453960 RepID=A0A2T2XLC1_9FIRM|nr:MAG: TlyA family rRNA (cytidine-2'-O)-methyltransferase [Sulfobacillus benefaciens]